MDDGKPNSHPPMVGGEDDMDVGDCSEEGEEEDEEEEEIEMGSSPLEDHGSLMMALASSNVLPYEGLASPLRLATSGGKPLGLRRGPGRPPRRGTPPHSTRPKKHLGLKLKRWKGSVYMPSDKSPRHSMDGDTMDGGSDRGVDVSPAHSSEANTTALSSDDKHDKFQTPYISDEPPYFQEAWPGKVCTLCNLSERTQLGQGEMIKVTCPEGFTPKKKNVVPSIMSPPNDPDDSSVGADKSPRCSTTPALSYRRQKSWSKCRNPSINGQEPLDELAIIGYTEEPDVTNLFENSNEQWVVYVHESCALWSLGISRPSDAGFQAIGQIVINASVKKCASCGKFGASTACTFSGCTKYFHLPCAAATGCFQDAKSYALVCNVHLHHVPLMPNLREVTCMSCFSLGDVSNLVMCSTCGNNYHGSCVGLALLPGSRAGWQCSDCRMCQVCRQPEDSKIMVCETCDKAYHPHCLRPVVTTIPKYGWKCKNCRLCSDCGSRTPGAGQSSRWHAHYTVCDSCYQQRNKGFSCPLCRRAYRAAAYREMVQCSKCKKFVHGTCDLEADLATYQLKKETTPDYEYVCPNCKSGIQNALKRKDSTEDFCMDSNMSASQESLLLDEFEFDCDKDGYSMGVGLGKGKPFSASKIAKKKLGLALGVPGRPGKGLGKVSGMNLSVMSSYQKKHQRCNEFGRKRIPKAKMRGIFGVPGLGLQRPQADTSQSKSDEEPGGENRLVLCSSKDKFVLTQDMCVMCGALGTDQEGCLIACAQCGQCYHPYCVSVKVTKVILQKGWRCLDCTVCEGCGQKNDEARLILCDDCDISYHIYCMDPPLSYVPRGTWKCKWCAQCLTCGANNPGFNCTWLRSYTECGPCASRTTCPSCAQGYGDGELIIKCIQCERWLHCACDQIRDESEAEFCAEEGYSCVLCRPRDVKPPHLLPGVFHSKPRPISPPHSPDYSKVMDKDDFYVVDGVKLSESGLHQIRALTIEQQVQPRKKRSGPRRHHGFLDKDIVRPPTFADKEAGILATIESVVAGDCGEDADDDSMAKEEAVSRYKEGMEVTPRPDGRAPEPPEGFSIYTTESGVMVLRRKRQRNLQRLGIGGFNARLRQTRCREKEEENGAGDGAPVTTPTTPGSDTVSTPTTPGVPITGGPDDKPRRKPQRRKPKSKLVENYPSYLQEAFFGRDLLDTTKETNQDLPSSSDESEDGVSKVTQDKTITLSQDELKVIEQMKIKQEKECDQKKSEEKSAISEEAEKSPVKQEDDEGSDSDALKDILRLPDNLLDTDLVNTIMTEGDGDIKSEDALITADDGELNRSSSTPSKDELSDILGPHFSLESMVRETGLPNMDCKDVEEIFKGVLTDESQESQESPGVFPIAAQNAPPIMSPSHSVIQTGIGMPRQPSSNLPPVVHSNLPSPITFPAASPYHSEYSNSPQFSPAFSEPPSPWADDGEGNGGPHSHYNQRNTLKMEADEALGNNATISCVLYSNINHPEWKKEYPTWGERSKQILKKWRALPSEKKAPYLQQARDNRANLRMKKAQQIPKELSPVGTPTSSNPTSGTIAASQTTSTGQTVAAPSKSEVAEELITLGEGSGKQQNPREDTQSTSSPEDLLPNPSPSSSQEPAQTLVSTGSNTSPFLTIPSPTTNKSIENIQETQITPSSVVPTPPSLPNQSARTPQITAVTQFQPIVTEIPQTFPTTIPSHPSTIQYIPLIPSGNGQTSSIRATFHIIPTKPIVTTSNETQRTIYQYDRGTIHYPPNSLQILQSVPPLIMTSSSVLSAAVHSNSDHISQVDQKSAQPRMLQLISTQRTVTTSTSPPQISVPVSPTIRSQVQFIQTIRTTNSSTSNNDAHDNNPSSRTPSNPPTSSPLSDQHIRVLTPSEIMRTLPSLGQENYDPPPSTEQDKLQQQQKNCREAEQERAWKQMQALRQQQAAQQQQVMQDQRTQAANRVHRQMSVDGGVLQMSSEPQSHLTSQLQVSTVQESGSLPSITSPSGVRTSQQFPSPVGLKAPLVGSPVGIPNYPRTPTPAMPIRGVLNSTTSQDPFNPPRQMQSVVHPTGVQGQEMNRQLRDLLQRQHIIKNKLESEQMIQQRVWPLQEDQSIGTSTTDTTTGGLSLLSPTVSQAQNTITFEPNNSVPAGTNSPTFRHPLPPSLARPTRLPLQQGQMIIRGQRMPPFSDPRMQGVDPRVRLLLQHQQRPGFSPNSQMVTRLSGPRNPLDPYDHLVQQRPDFQAEGSGGNIVRQIPPSLCNDSSRIQSGGTVANPPLDQQRIAVTSGEDSREEIPESVTAELEKLEQEEGSTIPEVENVGAILGDLVEDDDELLAEMGADFNILEYADPELDTVTGGEKTNILDVDLEEEETKKENASINNRSEKKEDGTPVQNSAPTSVIETTTSDTTVEKPLPSVSTKTTQSPTNQNPLPLMTITSSSNTTPSSQNSMVGGVLTQSSGGIVATVSYPATFPVANQPLPRIQHIGQVAQQQQQRLQQLQRLSGGPRVLSVGPGGHILPPQTGQSTSQPGPVNQSSGLIAASTGTSRLAPPPPPYPGPPPPYPGPIQQTQGEFRGLTSPRRRPLLLQEQPLLLEDLLEQEKREQEKQASVEPAPATALLSDADFERLRADVLGTTQGTVVASPPHGLPAQGILPAPGLVGQQPVLRPQFVSRPQSQQPQWQQAQSTIARTPVLQQETPLRVALFNAPVLPPPTPPPDIIATEQDRQQQLQYETWLNNQNHIVTQQLKYYETEVQKLRKIRKSLNSKQRQLRKNGNELAENDAMELQRVTTEQAVLQKQLESSRKQSRQHGVLIQEYRNKQQANKVVRQGGLSTSLHSSPSGSSPQSPLLTSPSPGPLSTSQQQSPRIGTPHSQSDDNPFSPGTSGTGPSDILRSLPSPSRLTSPSPRAITSPRAPNPPPPPPPPPSSTPRPNVGSPGTFSVQDQSIRPLGMPPRFVRSPESGGLRPRVAALPLQVPGPTSTPVVYQGPRSVTFNSNPQPVTDNKVVRLGGLTPQQQQLLLRQQLHQQRQALLQQQQELTQEAGGLRQIAQQRLEHQQQQNEGMTPQQRQIQLVHQKQALLQQQELLQQQLNEPNLTSQQRQQIMQQRQALLHQSTEVAVQEKTVRLLLQNQEGIEGSNINRQQIQMLQHRQQQFSQQTRQQLILSQQGKSGQFRGMIQQQQGSQQQSPSRSPMAQFGQTSPMPSHFSGTPTSPMPPQSPGQFPGSSPMHPQSPMVNQTQASSPILPQSPISVQQQFNQPNNSPMHSQSPMIQQYSNQPTPNSPLPPHSPRVQQFSNQTPNSPMTPQSPMIQNQNYQHQVTTPPMSYNQPPSSPMQSPRLQSQYGQPPSSPVTTPQSPLVQQSQFVHRPNSPMPPKSPMPPMGSPMPMRRPSSTGGSIASSPQVPDRPQSVENPMTPRTPQDYEVGGGGGNPHNPLNPIPFPVGFGRFGYIKLGLRGGSPMWGSDRQTSRKPPVSKVSRDSIGSSKSETSMSGMSLKTNSQMVDAQEQPSKPSDDNELTVYDDIVLVESCKDDDNLEVEELQSSLESNVMSMPMVLDSGHLPISGMNLGTGNVEGQLLEECLVSSTDLVVLDVEPSESEECLLEMVEKDHIVSGEQDLLILEDELVERESKGDESDVIELMEESSSPPTGRKRMAGKVLPGETLKRIQDKRDSTTDTPESPDQDESITDHLSETDNELITTTYENSEKSEIVSTTIMPEGFRLNEESKIKVEEAKTNFPVITSGTTSSSIHQTNIGMPGLSRQTLAYPTFSRNPSFPRHVLPIIKSDGRPVFAVQATVANLVQDAVNAAKLAAEKKNLNQGVSLSNSVVIPNILSTPSTIASLGVVSTTCSTLIGPPRMSIPFSSSGRVTVTSAPTGTHYVPILSQPDKLGLLKIEGIKVINQKIELTDKCSDKTSDKQVPKITSAMLITSHSSNETANTSDRIFQRRYFEDKFKSDIKTSTEENPITSQMQAATKFHNYSKVLVKANERQPSPVRLQNQEMDIESKRSDIIQKSEGTENLSSQNSIIIKNYVNESVRHAGVICNKRSSIDLTSSASSSNTSSVITQVSVISDHKASTTPLIQDNFYKSEGSILINEDSGSIGSSILEAQLTATSNKDDLLPRTSSAASPSKTLFSFLDNVGPPNRENKSQIKEPQSVSVNMSGLTLPFDDQTIHTQGMTLYRSSENITAASNIPLSFKSTQSISEVKLPTSVAEFKNIQEESRASSQPTVFNQSVRRIGNIYVHSQNLKSDSNISLSDSSASKDDTIEQKQIQRNVSVLYSTDNSFQTQPKDLETTAKDLNRASSMTDLLRSNQKRETMFERQISSESREIEKINAERQIGSSKSMPSRLGELISGSASVQAHIERRISIAGQTDLLGSRNNRFFQKEEAQVSENIQQRSISSSESSSSVMFTSGSTQRENITESSSTSTQFIPLSSMLTPKTEPEDKVIRISSHSVPRISEESQNVLLKQLLQNTACATTAATPTTAVNTSTIPPPLPVETQRTVVTTASVVSLPATVADQTQKVSQTPVTASASMVSVPKATTPPTPTQNIVSVTSTKTPQESPQPDIRRMSTGTPTSAGTPTSNLDELLSPTSSCSMPQTSPVVIKREPMLTPSQIKREPMQQAVTSQAVPVAQKSPVMVEVKKEIMSSDEMISPSLRQENPDLQMSGGGLEQNSNLPLDPQDIKKIKRRQYQQKRRQSQGKDAIGGTPKKRPRKNSKVEEDYDSFIDALMVQLRQTPAMSILEPSLSRNYTVCPIFGSGDLSKVSNNTRLGELKGLYGTAALPTESDYYNTQPYGDLLPVPPQSTPSTQRGFYNEEFAPLKLDTFKDELDERKLEFNRDRDNDTPDTIVSSSSPECVVPEIPIRYPGLRLIEDDDSDEDTILRKRGSPIIPLFMPQPVKPKSNKFLSDMDKENRYGDHALIKTRLSPTIPLKDSGNVTVTLTLTSAAADDVLGVLRNLANVLRIPAPTAFHITERTATPPSHKLGLYRCKGKDGKEGAPIDIQSILNGAAKFCRHCDVVILNNLIKKKASEMPFLSREEGSEDLYFCSSACYMQLALLHHPPSISKDKAAAIVDHLSQNGPSPPKKSRSSSTSDTTGDVKKSAKIELKTDILISQKMDLDDVLKPMTGVSSEIKECNKKEEIVEEKKLKVKGIKYRIFNFNSIPPPTSKHKKPTDKEMTDMLFRMGITVTPQKMPDDTRVCLFCHQIGDGVADGPARLLNYDVDKWVHLNCALWSDEVYETVNGALMNVETALQASLTAGCTLCHRTGATLKCYKMRCSAVYHLSCAVKDECIFYKNKTLYCNLHVPKNEKENELTTLAVFRRVYINRDENRQVASVMHYTEHNHLLRVGTLIFLNVGQLLPHQLAAFHTPNYIYPIGYKIVRFYWSMRVCNKRCRYVCSIHEANGRPEFRVLIQEPAQDDIELRDLSPRAVWTRILEPLLALRKANNNVQVFPRFVSGEDLFGLTEPVIVRVLESLPGVETLTDYRFKYGRNPLLELPLAINPSGCARCEGKPKGQGQWKRAHTQRTGSASRPNFTPTVGFAGDAVCPYSKQFVHSKSSQYKKMKQEWRNNVYLARSKIQGLGLYAARDLEKHTMVIEYIGEIIRTELAESREKQYEAKNRGIYMFRLDEERVVDATLSGGLARYINHSCNPNCVAETVEVERDQRIIIFAKRRINRGEELAYDYKFDIEDDQHKIPCMCGAPNCRKWMN